MKKTDRAEKIGIFGGTFDPVHLGHLFLAETAYDAAGLDRVLFMPAPDPYYRTDKRVSDAGHRTNMVKLAIKDNPHFEFSDFELGLDGPVYTADTLERFKKQNPDAGIYFIMGGDSVFSIENWKNPERIFSQAVILSSKRERETEGASGSCAPTSTELWTKNGGVKHEGEAECASGDRTPASSELWIREGGTGKEEKTEETPGNYVTASEDRSMQNGGVRAGDSLEDDFDRQVRYLSEKYGAKIINLQLPNIDISSSDIIRRIRAGKSIKYYVPDAVEEYIREHKLYL